MNKTRVAVLRGGPGIEYDVSLRSGQAVLNNLPEEYESLDVLVDRSKRFFLHGVERNLPYILERSDVIFNALRGEFGEDGEIQRSLNTFNFPYTGSSAFASAISMSKHAAKKVLGEYGIVTPRGEFLDMGDEEREFLFHDVLSDFKLPAIAKPAYGGSSLGVEYCDNPTSLMEGIEEASAYGTRMIIEEYLSGREVTCGIIKNFRGEELYALPPCEIMLSNGSRIFDFNAKMRGAARMICPSGMDKKIKQRIVELARRAHLALHLGHYSRSDFLVTESGTYLLEVNSLPALMESTPFHYSLEAVGASLGDFLSHIISLALKRNKI